MKIKSPSSAFQTGRVSRVVKEWMGDIESRSSNNTFMQKEGNWQKRNM
jgi:hypothetical protein